MTPCSLGGWNLRFEVTFYLHLQSRSDIPRTTNLSQGLACSTYAHILAWCNTSRVEFPFNVCNCRYVISSVSGGTAVVFRGAIGSNISSVFLFWKSLRPKYWLNVLNLTYSFKISHRYHTYIQHWHFIPRLQICVWVRYDYAKFLLSDSCGMLIIAIRVNTKHSLRIAATFVFVLQKCSNMPAAFVTTRFQHQVRH